MLKLKDCKIIQNHLLYEIESLNLAQGEFVALIGANGSGKSSFFNQLFFQKVPPGNVCFNSKKWNDISFQERSKLVTLVDNHFLGLDYLITHEYLELGRTTHTDIWGKIGTKDHAIVKEYSEKLRISHLLTQATSTLSDGERQRASIAKALIQETPLILLDEPTAFLDYPTKIEVMELLHNISKNEKKLIIIASHDIDFCLKYCTRFLIINQLKKQLVSFNQLTKEQLLNEAFNL